MTYELTDVQVAIRNLCRDFADEVVAPAAPSLDYEHRFPVQIVLQMGDLGLFGLGFGEEWGGSGGDFVSLCIAIEEISRADAGVGITLEAATGLGIAPIYRFGTLAQKERWLPELMSGRKLWAFGLTEPGAGSDVRATRTRALLSSERWVINGAKQFITNSGTELSAGVTITAVTEHDPVGRPEISTILVPNGSPGYTVGPSYRKLGWHSSDTHPLNFDDCAVPADHLLGTRGQGLQQMLSTLAAGRVAIAALSVGLGQACLDAALAYAGQRQAFGERIASHQAIQFMLADMETELQLARLAVYRAASMHTHGESTSGSQFRRWASMVKLFASETSKRCADRALQIHGGYGFIEDYAVARYWRDVKINEIGEGTSEVQRILVARELLSSGSQR